MQDCGRLGFTTQQHRWHHEYSRDDSLIRLSIEIVTIEKMMTVVQVSLSGSGYDHYQSLIQQKVTECLCPMEPG